MEAIAARRSIRRFQDRPIPEVAIQAILTAGTQAPSGKNRQPWRFVVVRAEQRAAMIRVMRGAVTRTLARGDDPSSAEGTADAMEQAPLTVFVFNPYGLDLGLKRSVDQMFLDVVDIQSIGAAIQNMLLAAQDQGIASLWICDVFVAYEELREWLGEEGQMVAAVSFGYAAESPLARPRRRVDEVTRWV
ncbi:MAG: nitroreductase [Gemmatimonadales bacterium]|nr:nitroreductase [Gemmatimonadales bacterium]